ncbi:hypothetical protein M8C21_021891 [Ambrosia artemisiifolia]|uniref:Uncharacterized protein n=1 Tax=Ambrosia artemisiifolia TaxID=4212 RepID=A0AAD5GQI8_AMBAR|nr:hypothetical protein M8C21_021891 [Ambrosia artemisiifolia]
MGRWVGLGLPKCIESDYRQLMCNSVKDFTIAIVITYLVYTLKDY